MSTSTAMRFPFRLMFRLYILPLMKRGLLLTVVSLCLMASTLPADDLAVVPVEHQPLAAQVSRVMKTLEILGDPLPPSDAAELKKLIQASSANSASVERIQAIL